jgi:hypothetical protein
MLVVFQATHVNKKDSILLLTFEFLVAILHAYHYEHVLLDSFNLCLPQQRR